MGTKEFIPKRKLNITISEINNANSSYIISIILDKIKIYFIESNKIIDVLINKDIIDTDMHHFYKTIFLTVSDNDINIWEISEKENECKKRISINGNKQNFFKAVFCKNDDKLLASYSKDATIKIWNFENRFCVKNISVNATVYKIEFFSDYLYYFEPNSITIYNNKLSEIEDRIKTDLHNFFVINSGSIITIKDNEIKYYDQIITKKKNNIRYYDINSFKYYKFETIINNIFYDNNLDILYIFFDDYLNIYEGNNFKFISKNDFNYTKLIFLDNKLNDENICGNFLTIHNPYIYTFISQKYYSKEKIIPLIEPEKDFWKNSVNLISNIISPKWNENILKDEIVYSKKYLEIEKIKKEFNENYKINLSEKRILVENQIKKFQNSNNIIDDYLRLLSFLIKNNINKDLIKIYLEFIEKNDEKLKEEFNKNYETFKNELKYYSIMLEKNELEIYKKYNINKTSEKESFFNCIEEIFEIYNKEQENNKINDNAQEKKENNQFIQNYIEYAKKELKNLHAFNQPIPFENQELYWYRNKIIILFSFEKIVEKGRLPYMINSIDEIKRRQLFTKSYILENKELLTILISLISIPQTKPYCSFNLNLIESKDNNYKLKSYLSECYYNEKEDYIIYKNTEENESDSTYKILNNASKKCFPNFLLHAQKKMKLKNKEFNNYHNLDAYFKGIININKINKFLSIIICSKTFREAFEYLYPKEYIFPFKDRIEAFEFLSKNFHYLPFKSLTTNAITEKLTLESYFFLKLKKIIYSDKLNNENKETTQDDIKNAKKLIKKIFYSSSVVKTNSHEMNHQYYNLLFFHSNGSYPLETPRKNLIEERESEKNLEMLLFNRVIRRLNLAEAMYLLNEKNYQKNLDEFREGLSRIDKEFKIEDLKFEEDCIFNEFNNIFKIENFEEISLNSFISCNDVNDGEENIFIDSTISGLEDENDVLGFLRK